MLLDSRFPRVREDGNDAVVRGVVSVQTYPSPSKNRLNSRTAIVVPVIPANAGIQFCFTRCAGFPLNAGMTWSGDEWCWIPAYAGMTWSGDEWHWIPAFPEFARTGMTHSCFS